jgi:hypothetical protein
MSRHKDNRNNNAASPQDGGAANDATVDEGGEPAKSGESTGNTEQSTTPGAASPQDGGVANTDKHDGAGDKNEPGNSGSSTTPPQTGKKRVRHPGGKAAKVIAGSVLVEFDVEGVAEIDAEQAEYLLSIPGYEEVRGKG